MNHMSILERDAFQIAEQALDNFGEEHAFEDFGDYRIIRVIGQGGMGEVLLAEHLPTRREVALKLIYVTGAVGEAGRMTTPETEMHARLEHPNIARLYETGAHPGGTQYFAMEYVDGRPLDRYCRENECSLDAILNVFLRICDAVQYAHSRAVIHLDVKPSNILVKADGTPMLLDFGVAKHLEKQQPALQTQRRYTPAYAAPEQLRGKPVGTFTDVYSLGVVLSELLARQHPYAKEDSTPGEVEAFVAGPDEPRDPSSSPDRVRASRTSWKDLDFICRKAMTKSVRGRYESVVELAQEIGRFVDDEPLQARGKDLSYRCAKFVRKYHKALLTAAAVVLLVAAITAVYGIRLRNARDSALAQAQRTQRIQRFMLSLFGGDEIAAPSGDLKVVDILKSGVDKAKGLRNEPAAQADLYITLGSIYESLGKLDLASSLMDSALRIRKSLFGPDDPNVAETLATIGWLRMDQARFGEAEQTLRNAVAMDRRHIPADDQRLGSVLSSLASVLMHRGAYEEAIQALNEAIRIQSRPGADQAEFAESLTFLSTSYHILGRDQEAQTMAERVLATHLRIYGDRHPSVAEDITNLGQIREQLGFYADAEQDGRKALAIIRAWYGNDHIESAVDAEGLAGTLIYEGKYDEAADLLQSAIPTLERDMGKDHTFVALGCNLRGMIALRRGSPDAAEPDFARMARIYKAAFGEHNTHFALSLLRLGELSLARRDYAQAEAFFRRAAEIYAKATSPSSVQTGAARIELGEALLRQSRYPEAESELVAGYKIVSPGRSPALEAAVQARRDLASLYKALKSPEKAAQFPVVPAAAMRRNLPR